MLTDEENTFTSDPSSVRCVELKDILEIISPEIKLPKCPRSRSLFFGPDPCSLLHHSASLLMSLPSMLPELEGEGAMG